jgi:GH25 family lysozyme M1 (1,4-beta-N-acetylmuramidase)|nr:MAG TPA: Morphogenesis protein 1 hydrolase [Caudoviricetes sp.]
MKPNKTYVASDGYEYFMCPMTEFKITQVENVGTHLGTKAVDFASGTAGYRAPYYAPATVKCIKTIPSYGEATWQTVNKVHCPNGYFGIVTFETVHDNTFNAYVGMVIKQGQQLGNMGDAGRASGVHLHIEFTQSANGNMAYNSYGIYTFTATESYVDDTFYVDDTNVITPMAGNWRKCNAGSGSTTSVYDPSQLIQEDGIAHFTNDTPIICHRDSPTGPKFGSYVKGETQRYTEKWVGNGHRYISWLYENDPSIRCFVAVSGSEVQGEDPWATFTAPEEENKPSEPEKPEKPETPEEPAKEFPDSVKMKGIDLSEHNNGNIDFSQYDFVILRANWWTTEDKKFKTFADKLDKLGIPYGVYCYDYCGDEKTALEQAEYTYNLIKDRDIKMGVWMDMEDADGWKQKNGYLNKEHCSMVCKVFCDFFKKRGYFTGVYASSSWFDSMIEENGYPKWIANWGSNDGTCQGDFSVDGVLHQYTSTPIDKDVAYHDLDFYKSNPTEEKPTDDQEPNEDDNVEDKPNEKPTEGGVDYGLINKVLKWILKLLKKIVNIFK